MKKFLIAILAFIGAFFVLSGNLVQADDFDNAIANEIPRLQYVGDSHTEEFTTATGEKGTITVTKIEEGEPEISFRWLHWHTRSNVSNGTYNVNVILGASNAGFTVTVNNKRITRAYDPWYFHIVASSATLTLDSSTQATYNINFSASIPWLGGPSWSGGVRARIENGALVTYVR